MLVNQRGLVRSGLVLLHPQLTQLPPSVVVQAEVSVSTGIPDWVFDPDAGNNDASDVNAVEAVFADGFE